MNLRHYTVIYDQERTDYQFHWHGQQVVRVFSMSRFNLHWEETDVISVSLDEGVTLEQRLATVLDVVAGWLETH